MGLVSKIKKVIDWLKGDTKMNKNEKRQGIYRFKEILLDEYCGCLWDEKQRRNVDGIVREYASQKYRIGELVAEKDNESDYISIGFSVCHPLDMKYYNKEVGISIAKDMFGIGDIKVPHGVRIDVCFFILRMKRYFKEATFPVWCEQLLVDNARHLPVIEEE